MSTQPQSEPRARGLLTASQVTSGKSKAWYLLLLLPWAGLIFPGVYSRQTPELDGIPFFYWYMFGWIVLTALLTGFVYWRIRSPQSLSD